MYFIRSRRFLQSAVHGFHFCNGKTLTHLIHFPSQIFPFFEMQGTSNHVGHHFLLWFYVFHQFTLWNWTKAKREQETLTFLWLLLMFSLKIIKVFFFYLYHALCIPPHICRWKLFWVMFSQKTHLPLRSHSHHQVLKRQTERFGINLNHLNKESRNGLGILSRTVDFLSRKNSGSLHVLIVKRLLDFGSFE